MIAEEIRSSSRPSSLSSRASHRQCYISVGQAGNIDKKELTDDGANAGPWSWEKKRASKHEAELVSLKSTAGMGFLTARKDRGGQASVLSCTKAPR